MLLTIIIFVFVYSGPYQTRVQPGDHSLSQWMWGKNSKEGCKCMHAGVVLWTGEWGLREVRLKFCDMHAMYMYIQKGKGVIECDLLCILN